MVDLLAKVFVVRPSVSGIERENVKGAIASLLQLYSGIQSLSIDLFTGKVLEFYGVSTDSSERRTLSGLFVKGSFPALDFSNLIVTNSRFQGYKNFLFSRFKNTQFMYSVFDGCLDLVPANSSLDPKMIDATCDAGDLREAFVLSKATKVDEQAMIQTEAVRFLHSFFRGDRFVDNKTAYIKFSSKVSGLAPDKFDRLIGQGFIVIAREKTIANFYAVNNDFKPSVRKLLADGYPDGKMRKFLNFIR